MKEQNQMELFRSGKVSAAVFKNAIPSMIAMIMVLIYNIADTFFIGQTHNDLQVAAVSMCTPVFLLFMAVGTVFGLGGTSVISRAMGEGRTEYAKKVSAFCMWSCVGVGILMSALFWLFMDQILLLMGASADTWDYAWSYMMIVTACGPFVLISNCYSNVLRAEGQANVAMMGMLLGNLANVILDPIMILGFGWEIEGAAIATVIGNVLAAVYYLLYFRKGTSMLSIHPRDFTVKEGVCKNVLIIGIPASLASLLMSISQIVMNSCMTQYGDMAVAGVGVSAKVTMMTGMVCIGLGQGVQPLLGYCVGARDWKRVKNVLIFSLGFAFVLSTVMTGVCYLFTEQIVRAFLTDAAAFEYGFRFSRIGLSTSILFGVYYVLTNTLQAMGAATPSLIINLSRQGLLYIPSLFILEAVLGIDGLLWAQPVVDVLSLLLAIVLYTQFRFSIEGTSILGFFVQVRDVTCLQGAKHNVKGELTVVQHGGVHFLCYMEVILVEPLLDAAVAVFQESLVDRTIRRIGQRRHLHMIPVMPQMVVLHLRSGEVHTVPGSSLGQIVEPPEDHFWGAVFDVVMLDLHQNGAFPGAADVHPLGRRFRLKFQGSCPDQRISRPKSGFSQFRVGVFVSLHKIPPILIFFIVSQWIL